MGSEREERNLVKRVQEILPDRPEPEILAMLKECGMNPDEAVQRLLSQDTFQEVKSKRERRKEMKETQETKSLSRMVGGFANGGWSMADDGRNAMLTNSNAPGTAVYKWENGSVAYSTSHTSSTAQAAGKPIRQQLPPDSDYFNTELRSQSIGTGGFVAPSSERLTNSEHFASVTGIGRPSVADIDRKGSLQSGSVELSESSFHRQDEGQESDARVNGENISSLEFHSASKGIPRTRPKDYTDEQMNPNGDSDISCETGIHQASSDSCEDSYTGKPLPEQTEEDSGTVVLPSHVQDLAANCSHLSFGTYNSKPHPSKTDSEFCDGLSTMQQYTNQWRRQQMPGPAFADPPLSLLPDSVSQGFVNPSDETIWEPVYTSSYRKEKFPQHLDEMRALGMQGNPLASSRHSLRTDVVPSTFHQDVSLPPGLGAAASSFNHSVVSLPETFTLDAFHPFDQRTTLSTRGVNHQLLEQVGSQKNNPLKQYENINSYVNFPNGYGQMPSQQSLASGKSFIPQYNRDNLPRNFGMPDHAASDFRSLQSANALRGGYVPNSAVASSFPTVGYDNIRPNQSIQGRNHFLPQHNDSLVGWGYGAAARGISTAHEKAYQNLLLEKQLNRLNPQDLQIRPDYASQANLRSYTQANTSPESQNLQSFGDMTLNTSVDPFSKQRHLWQR